MAHKDSLKAKGRVGIVLKDKDGNVKEKRDIENKVVDTGLAYIASRMVDANDSVMTHMALGSGSTAAAHNDTALGSQIGSRKTFTTATRRPVSLQRRQAARCCVERFFPWSTKMQMIR